jgi:tetratricopeptide (TPR) repeat protein
MCNEFKDRSAEMQQKRRSGEARLIIEQSLGIFCLLSFFRADTTNCQLVRGPKHVTPSRHQLQAHLLPVVQTLFCLLLAGCATTEMELFSRGEEQLKQKEYARAYDSFTRYLDLSPQSPSAYYNRALAAIGLSKYDEALDDLGETIRLSPGDLDARYMRYKLRAERREALFEDTTVTSVTRPLKQNLENALTVFMMDELNAILKMDAQDIWALNERGRMRHEQGEYDAALADYNAALALCDTCSWLLYNKALTLRACWRTREALAVLEALVAADSLDGEAWLLFGECKFALGRRKEACDAFRRSMEQGNPEAAERYSTLCR